MSKKFKRISFRIITFVAVLSILCSFTFFNSAAITVDNVTKSLLGLYRDGYFYKDLDYGVTHGTTDFVTSSELYPSIFIGHPFKGNGTNSFFNYYPFMPSDGISVGGVESGDIIGVQFALGFQAKDGLLFGAASQWSNDGSFYASDDFLRIECSFTSSIYFTNMNRVPTFSYYLYERNFDIDGNEELPTKLEYSLQPDIFNLDCSRINSDDWLVTFEMYIDTSKMKSLNFDTFLFTLYRSAPSTEDWFMICQSISIDNIPSSELPSLVPAPDPDVNQPFDDLEEELNGNVDDFLQGDSNGESFDEAIDGGSISADAVLPSGNPEFFSGDSSLTTGALYSFSARDGISFWSEIIRYIVDIPGIYAMFRFSLTIGLFSFLFGIVGSIVSKISNSSRRKASAKSSKNTKSKS